MYKTYATDTFKKIYNSLNQGEKDWINKTKAKLKESPSGKTLKYRWFKEKKYLNKRLYFLIDEKSRKILFISFAPKKEQQQIIDYVKANMKELLHYLKNLE